MSDEQIKEYVDYQIKEVLIQLGWYGDIFEYEDMRIHNRRGDYIQVDLTYIEDDRHMYKSMHIPIDDIIEYFTTKRDNKIDKILDGGDN